MERRKLEDFTGKVFGRLLVIGRANDTYDKKGHIIRKWKCICKCGNPNIVIIKHNNLKSGLTKSCGCLREEAIKKIKDKDKRLNEINYNRYGDRMKIVKYNSAANVIVQFENGFKIKTAYKCFKKGEVTNVYDKSVYNVGYLGEGIHKGDKKYGYCFKIWSSMLQRCYDEKKQKRTPTYKGCTVYNEWHNFQNFAEWYDENYYIVGNETMCLDKDILHKGNKIYSPKTCIFVPERINTLFIKCDAARGKYPIGVNYHKKLKKFQARCSILDDNNKNKREFLGYYNTPEEAFYAYKKFKEKYIKQVADEYKNKYPNFPRKLYDAMYKYKVEITD